MAEAQKLAVRTRTVLGKKVNALRRQGLLPGVLFGGHLDSTPVETDLHTFELSYRRWGNTTLLSLTGLDGGEVPALIHDVSRDPVRYRYRLCGTELVRSLGREVTGLWLDEAHSQVLENPASRERFRFMLETGRPTWRKGPPLWLRHVDHRTVESCIVPLATDGENVDKMLGFVMLFDSRGRPI